MARDSSVALEALAPEHRAALQKLYYKPLPERLTWPLLDDLRGSQYPHVCGTFHYVLRALVLDNHYTLDYARQAAKEALAFEDSLKEALAALRKALEDA